MEELKVYVEYDKQIDVLVLTEARITADIENEEIQLQGYKIIRCNSENRHTGGIVCYVKNNIKYEIICNEHYDKVLWMLCVKIKSMIFVLLYRSPSSSIAEFLMHLNNIMENLPMLKVKYVYVMGDLNIDMSKNSFYEHRLLKQMNDIGLKQIVNEYTRVTQESKTIIDVVFTNNTETDIEIKRTPKMSDHDMVNIKIKTNKKNIKKDEKVSYKFRNKKKIENANVENLLESKEWKLTNTNEMTNIFYCNIIDILDDIAPLETKISKGIKNEWFDQELKEMLQKRDRAYNKCHLEDTNENWTVYREQRNLATKTIRLKKRKYYEEIIERNKNSGKLMWKAIKEVIGNKKNNNEIESICFNGITITEKENIANEFNNYFVESIENIVETKSNINGDISNNLCIENKKIVPLNTFRMIKEEDIIDIIKEIKKDNSADEITMNIIKAGGAVMRREIMKIINKSIEEAIVPDRWKISTVIPVPKVSNTKKGEEHRPINMMPLAEKIMEMFIKQQFLDHLNKNDILIENQSGFRERHSCESSIQLLISKWKELIDQGKTVLTVFIDFKRAFETIDREILIKKLEAYGVVNKANKWFKNYLSDRFQQTKIGDYKSDIKQVKYGVPQGTVLGPILFITYVNDINRCIDESTILNLFADDTAISVFGDSTNEAVLQMQSELNKLEVWLSENNLFVNTKKTKAMLFSKNENELNNKLKLFEDELEFITECKYLGIIVDHRLSFKQHATYIIGKINKKLGYFNRISENLSMWSRTLVYKSIIAPHFEYCPTILHYLNQGDKSILQILQNKGMRIILKVNQYTRIEVMLDALKFMNINQRLVYLNVVFIYKIIHKLLPEYMFNKIKFVRDIHQYNTRSVNDIYVMRAKKTSTQNSLFYKGLVLYNSLPMSLKSIVTIKAFKRELSEYVKHEF